MSKEFDRRQFILGAVGGLAVLGFSGALSACSSTETAKKITFVFLPDNSSADLTESRVAVAEAIKAATGLEAEIMTTVDYNVAIEAIASGAAGMGLLGAEGYVQANNKNKKVQAVFTNSDENGSLTLAMYYSRIAVLSENVSEYKDGSKFTLKPLKGKSFSFVSATSTSGFKVPSSTLVKEFGLKDKEVLLQNGEFFSNVLLGGSHQGSLVNLASGDAQAAAFDDVDVDMYLDLVAGEPNMPGSRYKVKANAENPFDKVRGKEFTIIASTPVLNAPFVVNEDIISPENKKALVDHFCSSTVANDLRIFSDPKDKEAKALFKKASEKTGLVAVSDSWYEPIRKLSQA